MPDGDTFDAGRDDRLLRPGCHVLSFVPTLPRLRDVALAPLVGTLRVVQEDGLSLSGDLYRSGDSASWDPGSSQEIAVQLPHAKEGVPIFPIRAYDSYVRGLGLAKAGDGRLRLCYERYEFRDSGDWSYAGSFAADLERAEPSFYSPSPDDDWVGLVRDISGSVVGVLSITWASAYLRRARLRIASEDGAEVPLDNGQGVDWTAVMATVGWQLEVDFPVSIASVPDSGKWSEAKLHEAMYESLGDVDHDFEWCYRFLAVKDFDPAQLDPESMGVMFDRAADDLNQFPREGFAIAANFVFDNKFPPDLQGKRAGEVPGPFFRASVHEFGHALGLHHESNVPTFMAVTAAVARIAGDIPFPDNIVYEFSPESRLRLQHLPDVEVRPGGPFRNERPGTDFLQLPPKPRSIALGR